jgi:hypothetical protein
MSRKTPHIHDFTFYTVVMLRSEFIVVPVGMKSKCTTPLMSQKAILLQNVRFSTSSYWLGKPGIWPRKPDLYLARQDWPVAG